ncbi:TerC family protein [Sutterella sp.]|uniref:TerC family protein n=1 Tax=Sutterella sp. TaxID=1981025 RepID=UPI0026E0400C|nr:TerC family protein [Sutterella sp.]MDO5532399.1 TerC family protein [Sutterella sp.]
MEYIWDLLSNLHWAAVGQIIMIDILLGGDNAVVIAMACRNLPHEQRAKGIFWGTAGAIALRVVLITFAVMLLDLPFLKVVGAALLLWIGVKLLIPEFESHEKIEGSKKLIGAIKTIIVADFVMSFDNVIAIAGAAQQAHDDHQTMLVIFGLLVSVPFIVFGSQVVLKLLDRFPIIIYFGGGLLGWIAGGMMVSDGYVATHWPEFSFAAHYPACAIGAAIVVVVGHFIARKKRLEHEENLKLHKISKPAEGAAEAAPAETKEPTAV